MSKAYEPIDGATVCAELEQFIEKETIDPESYISVFNARTGDFLGYVVAVYDEDGVPNFDVDGEDIAR